MSEEHPNFTDEWMAAFRDWQRRLGLADWNISLVADRSISGYYADTFSIPDNQISTIRFNPDFPVCLGTVQHELAHVLDSHLRLAADQIVAQLPEGPAREMARHAVNGASERTVVLIMVALREVQVAHS